MQPYTIQADDNLIIAAARMRDVMTACSRNGRRNDVVTVDLTIGTYNLIDFLLRIVEHAETQTAQPAATVH